MIKGYLRDIFWGITGTASQKEYAEVKAYRSPQEYLRKLLLHAYQRVPYYHDVFQELGLVRHNSDEEAVDFTRFNEIPVLNKKIIRQQGRRLLSSDYTKRKWYYNSSGGSTGEPVRFVQDNVYRKWGNAAFLYWYRNFLDIDEPAVRKVLLWGSEQDIFKGGMGWEARIVNWLTNMVFLNSFWMSAEDMDRYIETINSYHPELIRGYAGSLYEISKHAEKTGKKIHPPKAVVSTAERLTGEIREKVEKVFGARVFDFYGSRETNNIAGECKEGLLHIMSFHNLVEILDDQNRPVAEGTEGKVIVTSLHNYSMPFIRYEIGDMAVASPEKCACGSPLPTLKKITGRITDYFIRQDGSLIHGEYFTHLFYLKDWVKAFQVVQEDYQLIKIMVALKENVIELEKRDIEDKVKLVLGQDCRINWEFVPEIPRTAQGKYLFARSLIKR